MQLGRVVEEIIRPGSNMAFDSERFPRGAA